MEKSSRAWLAKCHPGKLKTKLNRKISNKTKTQQKANMSLKTKMPKQQKTSKD